jgi:hypothetical protein
MTIRACHFVPLAILVAGSGLRAAEEPFTGELLVTLDGAAWRAETPEVGRPLTLRLECAEGR